MDISFCELWLTSELRQDFRAVPVDFEGIRRSFRSLIDDSTLLFEARGLQTSRAELLLGSLQVVLCLYLIG